jgi:hypothetical protein
MLRKTYLTDYNYKQKCPPAFPHADNLTHMCTGSCSKGQFAFLIAGTNQWGTCLFYCSDGYFSNPLTGKCVTLATGCPVGYFS